MCDTDETTEAAQQGQSMGQPPLGLQPLGGLDVFLSLLRSECGNVRVLTLELLAVFRGALALPPAAALGQRRGRDREDKEEEVEALRVQKRLLGVARVEHRRSVHTY